MSFRFDRGQKVRYRGPKYPDAVGLVVKRYGEAENNTCNLYCVKFWNCTVLLCEAEIECVGLVGIVVGSFADWMERFFCCAAWLINFFFPPSYGTELYRPVWQISDSVRRGGFLAKARAVCWAAWSKYMVSLRKTFSW